MVVSIESCLLLPPLYSIAQQNGIIIISIFLMFDMSTMGKTASRLTTNREGSKNLNDYGS